MPAGVFADISAMDAAALTPEMASTAMPPMIQGVRLPPLSEPWPQRGRSISAA